MSIKIIADGRDEFPENLRSEAKEVDGRFELDGAGVLKKNSELLGKNAKLTTRAEEAEAAKESSDATAKEWKSKANIPVGQKLVADDVAELGEAALAAKITKDEMPTLKTAASDLQSRIDAFEGEKVIGEVVRAEKLNELFTRDARVKGLKFEKQTATVDGKVLDTWFVKGEADAKTRVDEFLKTDEFFKVGNYAAADAGKSGFQYPEQKPDRANVGNPVNPVDARMAKYSPPAAAAVTVQ
ncbi:MAG TPA: hypothetical protein VNI84_21075 [Pyrinomonadaceae bacterium]|nr:hypothetical protein [Pyrinomonadaceae bacterium]